MLQNFLKRRIVKDAFLYSVSQFLIQLSSLLGILLVSRYLGPTNLGVYSFAQNYLAAFITVVSGMDIYANWSCVQGEKYYESLTKYTKIKASIMFVIIFFFLVFSFLSLPKAIFVYSLLLVLPMVTSIFSSYVFVLQYKNKSELLAKVTTISALVLLVAKVLAVYVQAPLYIFIAINSLDGGFVCAVSYFYIFRNNKNNNYDTSVSFEDYKKIAAVSILPVIYVVTWFVLVRIDQFLIPAYFSAYSLGIYSAAVKVTEMTNVLIVILQSLIVPRVFLLQSPEKDMKRTHLSLLVYVTLGVLSAGLICVFAPRIVTMLFGKEYAEAVPLLRVYAWTIPGLFASYFFGVIAMSKQTYKELALVSSILAVFSVLLSLLAATFGSVLLVALVSVIVYNFSACIFYVSWRLGRL